MPEVETLIRDRGAMTLEWMKIKSLINQIQSSLPEPNKGSFQIMCDGSGDFSSTFFSPEGVVSRSAALEFLGRRVGIWRRRGLLGQKVFQVGAKSNVILFTGSATVLWLVPAKARALVVAYDLGIAGIFSSSTSGMTSVGKNLPMT